jgi:signal peptide peptidase SppA
MLLFLGGCSLLAVIGLYFLDGEMEGFAPFADKVAVVEIHGPILDSENWVELLEECEESESIAAVVLDIDSPGGGIAPTQQICDAIEKVVEADKPVLASMGSVAASGGYYVACAADEVYAMPGSLTGSIGVYIQLMDLTELLEKIGVEFDFVKKGAYKTAGDFSREMKDYERKMFQAVVDDYYQQFLEAVTENREKNRVSLARGWKEEPPGGPLEGGVGLPGGSGGVMYPSPAWMGLGIGPGGFGLVASASEVVSATDAVEAASEVDSASPAEVSHDLAKKDEKEKVDSELEKFANGLTEENIKTRIGELAEGRIYTGRQAQRVGLVDDLKTLSEVIELAGERAGLGDDPKVVHKSPRKDRGWLGALKIEARLFDGSQFLYFCPYGH